MILTMLPLLVLLLICSFLEVIDRQRLLQTDHAFHFRYLADIQPGLYDWHMFLTDFVNDPSEFHPMQFATGAPVIGPAALHFMLRSPERWFELDVLVQESQAGPAEICLRQQGFERVHHCCVCHNRAHRVRAKAAFKYRSTGYHVLRLYNKACQTYLRILVT